MKLFYLILNVLVLDFVAIAEETPFNWSIKGEGGYYRAGGSSIFNQSDLFSQFQGRVRYKKNRPDDAWLLELKVRPEFYGLENNITIFKLSGKGQYQHRSRNFHLGFSLTSQKNLYSGNKLDLNFSIFKLSGNLLWFYKRRTFFAVNINYFYRDLNNAFRNSLDAVTLIGKIYRSFSAFGKVGFGAYGEKFQIANDITNIPPHGLNENNGWRIGPEVSLDYRRHLVVNLNYHFLFHESDLPQDPDNEQWIQLLLGKLLSSRWSVFLLADYYFRHFSNQPDINNQLVYLPIDNENNLYMKLEYDINKAVNLFFNLGYSKENLVYGNLNLSGFKGTVGVDFQK